MERDGKNWSWKSWTPKMCCFSCLGGGQPPEFLGDKTLQLQLKLYPRRCFICMTNQFIFWEQINVIEDRYSARDYRGKELSLDSLLSGPPCPAFSWRSILNSSTYCMTSEETHPWNALHLICIPTSFLHIIDTPLNYLPMFLNFTVICSDTPWGTILLLCLITQKKAPWGITALRPSERPSAQCELST